ncbi:hypothetical protein HID58_037020 [Brassica napus]|uniref:Uncharacterized protein n=1 Tax=Brassica napus TaxID=3708 RepID=A0ABQ8C9C6_BRANA|nr:hypothetical protein HID58_037020 [Brassica napus]
MVWALFTRISHESFSFTLSSSLLQTLESSIDPLLLNHNSSSSQSINFFLMISFMAMKPNGKSIVSSGYDEKVMFFKDVSLGHHEAQLRFRLIHFWEAWNPVKKTELEDLFTNSTTSMDPETSLCFGLLIIPQPCRSHGTQNCRFFETVAPLLMKTVSGFIRMKSFKLTLISREISSVSSVIPHIIYRKLNRDHTATVSFSWDSKLSVLRDCRTPFDEDSFRFHSYEEFQANSDLKGDLFVNYLFGVILLTLLMINGIDVVGHMKLVDSQSINKFPVLDEVEIAKARRLLWTRDEALPLGSGCKKILQKVQFIRKYTHRVTGHDRKHEDSRRYSCLGTNVLLACSYEIRCPTYYRLLRLTIGQRHKFCVKVTEHNLSGKTQSLTVTKILPLDTASNSILGRKQHDCNFGGNIQKPCGFCRGEYEEQSMNSANVWTVNA